MTRLQGVFERYFGRSRAVSRAQVDVAAMRTLQRLRQDPMWESDAPLFEATAGPQTVASAFLGRRSSQSEGGRRKSRTRWVQVAAAAVVALVVGGLVVRGLAGRRSVAAVVEAGESSIYRVAGDQVRPLGATERIGVGDLVRSNGGIGGMLRLVDGSRVEMRSQSELTFERADDGVRIRLNTGGIIVNAANQRDGHLYVQTKDVTVSVVGTVFLVNAEEQGSRVAVIEGEVRVQQGGTAQKLLPGEQVATNPAMASAPVVDEIAWSRNAERHRGMLLQSAVRAPTVQPAAVSAEAREVFEEISVRLSAPLPTGGRSGSPPGSPAPAVIPTGAPCIGLDVQVDPRRFAVRGIPLHGLITMAYGRTCQATEQIVGGPVWVRVDGYDVEAALPAGSPGYTERHIRNGTAPRLQAMLQAMLADRFKLVVRREMREMAAYNLVVVTAGKVTPSPDQQNAPDRAATTIYSPPAGGPWIRMPWSPMSRFASSLQMYVGRPVIDKTELKGLFDVAVDFPELAGAGRGGADVRPLIGEQLPRRLQEQLGLTLEPVRAPVEFLVIERAERPSDN